MDRRYRYNSAIYVNHGYDRAKEKPEVVDTWAGRIDTKLYGHDLQNLCQRTQDNLDRIAQRMSKMDPCVQYGIKHWHPDHRPQSARFANTAKQPDPEKVKWHDTNVMFTSSENLKDLGKPSPSKENLEDDSSVISHSTGGQLSTFCYLCSTIEEHKRHMLHHRPKRPVTAKPRIEYIAPKPRLKPKEEEEEKVIPEKLYKVEVYTGDVNCAGTSANVFITIKGSRNILNKTKLTKARGSANFCFMRNTKENFFLKAPNLGNLEIITIEHDGLEKKHGWYLERIEITDVENEITWVFWCNNWLSLHIKDFQIRRDLYAKEKERQKCAYEIEVVTGKKKFAGTDAKVYITIYGSLGPSKKILLADRSKNKDAFERGRTDHFRLLMHDLGEIRKIRIEHDGEGFAAGWYLEKITITKQEPKETYYFLYGGWIARDAGKGELFREIKAKKTLPREIDSAMRGNTTTYIVTVLTGDVKYAGTDANVFIQFCGNGGRTTKKLKLDDAKNNFERGMTDEFKELKLEAIDVGPLAYIIIGHDNSGPGAGWNLDHVKVKRYLGKKEINEYMKKAKKKYQRENTREDEEEEDDEDYRRSKRPSSARPDQRRRNVQETKRNKMNKRIKDGDSDDSSSSSESDDERNVRRRNRRESSLHRSFRRELDLSDIEEEGGKYKSQKFDKNKRRNSSSYDRSKRRESSVKKDLRQKDDVIGTLKKPLYEEYMFPCKNWFASDEGDGLFERELKYSSKEMYFME